MNDTRDFFSNGYVLKKNLIEPSELSKIENDCVNLINKKYQTDFQYLDSDQFTDFICKNRDAERYLYEEIRKEKSLYRVAASKNITDIVSTILDSKNITLLEKIPFRIDCPLVMRELAVWHQDIFYVKGCPDTITVWIPLFDVSFKEGCLMIMPKSHLNGPIEHNMNILKKKYYPESIFDNEVRYVEMKRGDALFFHSQLLHSSGNNISDRIRYSIQARYIRSSAKSDPAMGKRLDIL